MFKTEIFVDRFSGDYGWVRFGGQPLEESGSRPRQVSAGAVLIITRLTAIALP
jgi:hypothetical protein